MRKLGFVAVCRRLAPVSVLVIVGCTRLGGQHVSMQTDDIIAQRNLANWLFSQGPAIEKASSVTLFEHLADRGDSTSQFILGGLYLQGDGINRDADKGVSWMLKAANADNPQAQYLMGQMSLNGNGVPQSNAEAKKWAARAVANGNPAANLTLGIVALKDASDPSTALPFFQSAADNRIAAGMWYLGDAYLEGKGVPVDPVIAYAWFSLMRQNANFSSDFLMSRRGTGQLETVLLPEQRAVGAQLARTWVPGQDLAAKLKDARNASMDTTHWDSSAETVLVASPTLARLAGLPSTRKHLDMRYKVNEDGSYVETVHLEIQVHNQSAAQSLAQPSFMYNEKLDELVIEEAYTLKADGRRLQVSPSAIHDQLPQESAEALQFSDDRQKAVIFPDVQAGDTLVYTLRYTCKPRIPHAFMAIRSFTPLIQDEDVNIHIWAPKTLPLMTESHDMRFEKKAADDGVEYLWHWQNPNPLAEYPIAMDELDRAPRMFASSFKSYEELGRAFGMLNAGMADVTPKVKALAEQIAPGDGDPRRQAEMIYDWVRKNIRYVQIILGAEGAMQSHDADSIMVNGYGDCKDHSTLFSALLAAKGIASETVLVNLGNNYTLSGPPTLGALNHAITWIPQLGLYLDTTAGVAPFGTLPFEEYGKPVVHTLPGKEVISHIPTLAPREATIENRVTMRMAADGSITGENRTIATGPYAVKLRHVAMNVQSYGNEAIAKEVLKDWGIQGTGGFDIDPLYLSEPKYELNGHFTVLARPDYLNGASFRLPYGVMVVGRPGDDLIGPYDLVDMSAAEPTPCFSGRQTFDAQIELPKGVSVKELPKDVELKEKLVSYSSRWSMQGNTLALHREFESQISQPVCLGDVRRQAAKILNGIRSDAFTSVTLVKS